MARKASDRHKVGDIGEIHLNLNPMMDLFAVLIPALLMLSAVVEVAVINVSAPSIGGAPPDQPPPSTEKPLNLTVTITERGYIVAGQGAVLGGEQALPGQPQGPTIPIIQKAIVCSKFRGTWPPPRSKNKEVPACRQDEALAKKTFWVYDVDALTKKITEIKDAFPTEHRIIVAAEPDIQYEAITDVLDATREIKEASGEVRTLFDEVILSPGML